MITEALFQRVKCRFSRAVPGRYLIQFPLVEKAAGKARDGCIRLSSPNVSRRKADAHVYPGR